MFSANQKNIRKKKNEIDFLQVFNAVFLVFLVISVLWFLKWVYFDIYKPAEKKYIRNSRYAYEIIQKELTKYYRQKGFVYDSEKEETIDGLCETIRKKYSPLYGKCIVEDKISTEPNIVFKSKNIHIYGFERKPFFSGDTLVKDVIVDVDGYKGENTFGVDQVPIRIYSSGRMGGMLSPVNCKKEDTEEFEVPYSPVCPAGFDFDFMDSKIPFSYDVMQVGGKDGKSRRLNQNVPFLRADCIAFGSEILGTTDFCDKRGYHWLTACYHEYFCAIKFHDKE